MLNSEYSEYSGALGWVIDFEGSPKTKVFLTELINFFFNDGLFGPYIIGFVDDYTAYDTDNYRQGFTLLFKNDMISFSVEICNGHFK